MSGDHDDTVVGGTLSFITDPEVYEAFVREGVVQDYPENQVTDARGDLSDMDEAFAEAGRFVGNILARLFQRDVTFKMLKDDHGTYLYIFPIHSDQELDLLGDAVAKNHLVLAARVCLKYLDCPVPKGTKVLLKFTKMSEEGFGDE